VNEQPPWKDSDVKLTTDINPLVMYLSREFSQMLIVLIKHHSLNPVTLTALYKQTDKTTFYIHFNKQNIKYSIYHKHNYLESNNYAYIPTHTYTRKYTCTRMVELTHEVVEGLGLGLPYNKNQVDPITKSKTCISH